MERWWGNSLRLGCWKRSRFGNEDHKFSFRRVGLTYLYSIQVGMSSRALKIGTWSSEEKFGQRHTSGICQHIDNNCSSRRIRLASRNKNRMRRRPRTESYLLWEHWLKLKKINNLNPKTFSPWKDSFLFVAAVAICYVTSLLDVY